MSDFCSTVKVQCVGEFLVRTGISGRFLTLRSRPQTHVVDRIRSDWRGRREHSFFLVLLFLERNTFSTNDSPFPIIWEHWRRKSAWRRWTLRPLARGRKHSAKSRTSELPVTCRRSPKSDGLLLKTDRRTVKHWDLILLYSVYNENGRTIYSVNSLPCVPYIAISYTFT